MRAFRRLPLPALLAGSLAASGAAAELPRPTGWSRATTRSALVAAHSPAAVRSLGGELDRFLAAMAVLRPELSGPAARPAVLLGFPDAATMDPFEPRWGGHPGSVTGFFCGGTGRDFLAVEARGGGDPRPVLRHEAVHRLLAGRIREAPPWLAEGLAELYSTLEADAGRAVVGIPPSGHLRTLREQPLLPAATLLAVRQDSPAYNDSRLQALFYAESWALVHRLALRTPERFSALLSALAAGAPLPSADELLPEEEFAALAADSRGGRFESVAFPLPDFGPKVTIEPAALPDGSLAVLLGELLAASPENRSADAELLFRRALELSPGEPEALSGLAQLRLAAGDRGSALSFLRQAAAGPAATAEVRLRLGRLLLDDASARPFIPGALPPATRRLVDEARRELECASIRQPENAEAAAELGRSFLFEAGAGAAEGIPHLGRALAALPGRPELLLRLATLEARAGNENAAAALEREAFATPGPTDLPRAALALALERTARLVAAERYAEAAAKIRALAGDAPPEMRGDLLRRADELDRSERHHRAVLAYNSAVTLANSGELPQALDRLRTLLREDPDGDLSGNARELLERLEKRLAKRRQWR